MASNKSASTNNSTGHEENSKEIPKTRKTRKHKLSVQKKPQRGVGVAKLERLRVEESLAHLEHTNIQNQLQPPLLPIYMQEGGPACYAGYPILANGGYPAVLGYPHQHALTSPYGYYPVDYTNFQYGNPVQHPLMPMPPGACHGFCCSKNCTNGGSSSGVPVGLEFSLGNPNFSGSQIHGQILESGDNKLHGHEASGHAPDVPNFNVKEGAVANSPDKEEVLADASAAEMASEASPEATTTATDDQDTTAVDLSLKL